MTSKVWTIISPIKAKWKVKLAFSALSKLWSQKTKKKKWWSLNWCFDSLLFNNNFKHRLRTWIEKNNFFFKIKNKIKKEKQKLGFVLACHCPMWCVHILSNVKGLCASSGPMGSFSQVTQLPKKNPLLIFFNNYFIYWEISFVINSIYKSVTFCICLQKSRPILKLKIKTNDYCILNVSDKFYFKVVNLKSIKYKFKLIF